MTKPEFLRKKWQFPLTLAELQVDENGCLLMSVHLPKWENLWATYLLQLTDEELELNAGRFRAFQREPLEYEVVVPHTGLDPANGWASTVVGWIDNQNSGKPWSLRCTAFDVSQFDLIFSFQDGLEAAHFALRWR